MGNEDGIIEAVCAVGKNLKEMFEGGYFSFAFGNEIALCMNGDYFILNCNEKLWKEVKEKIKEYGGNKDNLISFWKEKSKEYEISEWSEDFIYLDGCSAGEGE